MGRQMADEVIDFSTRGFMLSGVYNMLYDRQDKPIHSNSYSWPAMLNGDVD